MWPIRGKVTDEFNDNFLKVVVEHGFAAQRQWEGVASSDMTRAWRRLAVRLAELGTQAAAKGDQRAAWLLLIAASPGGHLLEPAVRDDAIATLLGLGMLPEELRQSPEAVGAYTTLLTGIDEKPGPESAGIASLIALALQLGQDEHRDYAAWVFIQLLRTRREPLSSEVELQVITALSALLVEMVRHRDDFAVSTFGFLIDNYRENPAAAEAIDAVRHAFMDRRFMRQRRF